LAAGTDETLFGWSGYLRLDISRKRMELKGISDESSGQC
jgi:hypothetical protein